MQLISVIHNNGKYSIFYVYAVMHSILYSYNGRHLGKTINSAIILYIQYKSFANTYNISHLQRLIIYLKEKQEVNKLL